MTKFDYIKRAQEKRAKEFQRSFNTYMQNPSKDFARDLNTDYYVNQGLSESGKAMKVLIFCEYDTREDGKLYSHFTFWVPVSVVKDNIIPKWFVNKMMNEKINNGTIITNICSKLNK
jgi:hypothetical protein